MEDASVVRMMQLLIEIDDTDIGASGGERLPPVRSPAAPPTADAPRTACSGGTRVTAGRNRP
jgi:hypothetical protein